MMYVTERRHTRAQRLCSSRTAL